MRRMYLKVKSPVVDGIPVKIQNLEATDSFGSVTVSWDELEDYGITGYEVWKKTNDASWVLERELTLEDLAYGFFIVDIDVEEGNTYHYRVRGKNAEGKYTGWSNEDSVTIEEEVIFNPPTLTAEMVTGGIQITWTVDSNNTITTTHNQLEKIENDGSPVTFNMDPDSNTVKDTDVEEGSTYKFRMRAYNADEGYSEWSEQKTVAYNPAPSYDRNFQIQFTVTGSLHNGKVVGVDIYVPQVPITPNFPYVVYCHGASEYSNNSSGPDYPRLRSGAGPAQLVSQGWDFPCIIISPQLPRYQQAWSTEFMDEVIANVKLSIPEININRVGVMGWSNGKGVWMYAKDKPENTAVCIPFAVAGENPQGADACSMLAAGDTAVWIFHSKDDPTISSAGSIGTFNALLNCSDDNNVYMSLGSGSAHDCVTPVLKGESWAVDAGYKPYPDSGYTVWDFIMDNY